ncbi:MAG: hypothetical protein ACYC5N_11540, partial [Endomicrobiales bacterium]
VIVISGRPFIKKYLPGEDTSDKQKKEEVLKMADGFINKPFDNMETLEKIKRLLGEGAPAPAPGKCNRAQGIHRDAGVRGNKEIK